MQPIHPEAQAIIDALKLVPHPEGGFYREVYRSTETIPGEALPARYVSARAVSTSIYYLLTADSFSAMHRLGSDEIFHFYAGDPVNMLQLHSDGTVTRHQLGHNLHANQVPQICVPQGVWQGMRLEEGGHFALLGCTVAPGFDFADFALGTREALIVTWPSAIDEITLLTPST